MTARRNEKSVALNKRRIEEKWELSTGKERRGEISLTNGELFARRRQVRTDKQGSPRSKKTASLVQSSRKNENEGEKKSGGKEEDLTLSPSNPTREEDIARRRMAPTFLKDSNERAENNLKDREGKMRNESGSL